MKLHASSKRKLVKFLGLPIGSNSNDLLDAAYRLSETQILAAGTRLLHVSDSGGRGNISAAITYQMIMILMTPIFRSDSQIIDTLK